MLTPLYKRDVKPQIEPLLINAREARRLLGGVSERWLREISAPHGPLPTVRIRRRVLYRMADLDAFIISRVVNADPAWTKRIRKQLAEVDRDVSKVFGTKPVHG